jgi:phenylacetate-CoA ligase
MSRLSAFLAYRLQEGLLGRPTFPLLRELEASQWWSPSRVVELQRMRLNTLLRSALAHSPWHAARIAAAGLREAAELGSVHLEDLRRIPPMSRQDARDNVEALVWREVPGGAFKYNTGGSSGEPLIFHYGRDRQAADAACRFRARAWWGVRPGDREAYLWGAPTELNKTDRVKQLRDRLVNHRVLNAFSMTPARMDTYIDTLESWQPACLYGYASSVALFAAHLQARGRHPALSGLKVVCTTGEPLFPHQRQLIETVFGVPVANEYGCRDGGLIAHEAPGGQLLVMSECIIVELLDPLGMPVAPGEAGEVVLTNLYSTAQPFIRYRTGDVARRAEVPATDRRGLEVLSEVTGRSTDFVVAADGTPMHALAVIYEIRSVEGVREFKCVQNSIMEFEVYIVPGPGWNDRALSQIRNGLMSRLGSPVAVRINIVNDIAPELSGKHRYVISHVRSNADVKTYHDSTPTLENHAAAGTSNGPDDASSSGTS